MRWCEVINAHSHLLYNSYIYIYIINHYYIKATKPPSSSSQATGGLGSESKGMTTCATEWPSVRGSILGCNFHWEAVHPVHPVPKKTSSLTRCHWQDSRCPNMPKVQPMAIHGPHRWKSHKESSESSGSTLACPFACPPKISCFIGHKSKVMVKVLHGFAPFYTILFPWKFRSQTSKRHRPRRWARNDTKKSSTACCNPLGSRTLLLRSRRAPVETAFYSSSVIAIDK